MGRAKLADNREPSLNYVPSGLAFFENFFLMLRAQCRNMKNISLGISDPFLDGPLKDHGTNH
jgi:hypothetical protein